MKPVEAACAVVRDHHPGARAAFLCGSVLTGRRTPTSDLDIVVLIDGPPAPYRESLIFAGWPVELFVHTEESWHRYVDREIAHRRSPLLRMCAAGTLLADSDGVGTRLADEARALLAAGPPEATLAEIEDRRYALTDLLDDLAACTDEGERLFIVTELATRTAQLVLMLKSSWLGSGKWLARELDQQAPGLAHRLDAAVRQALVGFSGALVGLAEEVLTQAGGRLWAGYRRDGTP
ncbi:MAG: nucleotidyltransferase domain-containing protein [Streptomycetaceae bacterium]|nr:nucleotidyltransferase domain-containing protein [Streptomycetaceae bacterium]